MLHRTRATRSHSFYPLTIHSSIHLQTHSHSTNHSLIPQAHAIIPLHMHAHMYTLVHSHYVVSFYKLVTLSSTYHYMLETFNVKNISGCRFDCCIINNGDSSPAGFLFVWRKMPFSCCVTNDFCELCDFCQHSSSSSLFFKSFHMSDIRLFLQLSS